MEDFLTGGCRCGAIRYRVKPPLGIVCVCHCRMCQKVGGNFGLAFVTAPDLVWTRGEPSMFASSSAYYRGFCRDCGTPLFMRANNEPDDITLVRSITPTVSEALTPKSASRANADGLPACRPPDGSLRPKPARPRARSRTTSIRIMTGRNSRCDADCDQV